MIRHAQAANAPAAVNFLFIDLDHCYLVCRRVIRRGTGSPTRRYRQKEFSRWHKQSRSRSQSPGNPTTSRSRPFWHTAREQNSGRWAKRCGTSVHESPTLNGSRRATGDPVRLVLKADEGRVPDLLPLRHGRMVLSPFTFYRGSALAMAMDLEGTPATGVRVQCGGDSPPGQLPGSRHPEESRVIFAINDLDETLPAPWEWDLKRLATSFVIACRDNGLPESTAKDAALSCVRVLPRTHGRVGPNEVLDLWYFALEAEMRSRASRMPGSAGARSRVWRRRVRAAPPRASSPRFVDPSGGLAGDQSTSSQQSSTGKITPWRGPAGRPGRPSPGTEKP